MALALVEKAETEKEDITHQAISQEERSPELGSTYPDGQKKYGSRIFNNVSYSVFTCNVSQVWDGTETSTEVEHG